MVFYKKLIYNYQEIIIPNIKDRGKKLYSYITRYLIISFLAFLHGTFAMENTYDFKQEELEKRITSNYSINLMWINEKLDVQQQYIFPGVNNPQELREKFLNNAIGWSDGNPKDGGGHVYIWYDSKYTTPAAIEATEQELADYPIPLRDTRTSPVISDPKNSQVFSDETDVWHRADNQRIIISVEETESGATNCFIFANFNMKPIPKSEIFDPKSIKNLSGCGLVMAHNVTPNASNWTCATNAFPKQIQRTTGFENCFFMYSNLGTTNHQVMNSCLKYIMMEGSIKLAKKCFAEGRTPSRNDVFFLYGKLYSYYVGKTKGYTIGRYVNGKFIEFKDKNYLDELGQRAQHVFDFKDQKNNIIQIPTKDIKAPTTQSGFKGIDMSNVFIIDQTKLSTLTPFLFPLKK